MTDDAQPPPDKMRTAPEVAARCIILLGVVAAGHGNSRPQIVNWLRKQNLWPQVSPNESAFLHSVNPTEQEFRNATWRAEALHALVWSLDRIPDLCSPTELCDIDLLREVLPDLEADTSGFIASSHLRDEGTIHQLLGGIYHVHWRVRDAQINGRQVPDSIDAGAVFERHYAYNWLTGYGNQEWDEVMTDT